MEYDYGDCGRDFARDDYFRDGGRDSAFQNYPEIDRPH